MAVIAAVFHWPLSEMDAMGLLELARWRGKAEQILERGRQ